MADDELINQDDIEKLLAQSSGGGEPAADDASAAAGGGDDAVSQDEIEALLGGGATPPAAAGDPQPPAVPETDAPAAGHAQPAASQPAIEDADKLLGQDDIEKLLSQAGKTAPDSQPSPEKERTPGSTLVAEGSVPQGDIDYLLGQAEKALASVTQQSASLPPDAAQFSFREFSGTPANTETATLDLLNDVELDLKIELGRTNMYLEDVLRLRKGSVVPLDKLAGDPVDIYVNGRLIARGEVLVLNDNFCVRVAELIAGVSPVC